jgi:transcriptional regulator with XRE-family HTH domain
MNRLREWRRRKGISLAELARRTRTTASQISKLERGQRRLTVDWLSRLAPALGCRREDLLPPAAAPGRDGPLPAVDRELLRRMVGLLSRHLDEEGIALAPQGILESALALHDVVVLRQPGGEGEEMPPEIKPIIRLLARA